MSGWSGVPTVADNADNDGIIAESVLNIESSLHSRIPLIGPGTGNRRNTITECYKEHTVGNT